MPARDARAIGHARVRRALRIGRDLRIIGLTKKFRLRERLLCEPSRHMTIRIVRMHGAISAVMRPCRSGRNGDGESRGEKSQRDKGPARRREHNHHSSFVDTPISHRLARKMRGCGEKKTAVQQRSNAWSEVQRTFSRQKKAMP